MKAVVSTVTCESPTPRATAQVQSPNPAHPNPNPRSTPIYWAFLRRPVGTPKIRTSAPKNIHHPPLQKIRSKIGSSKARNSAGPGGGQGRGTRGDAGERSRRPKGPTEKGPPFALGTEWSLPSKPVFSFFFLLFFLFFSGFPFSRFFFSFGGALFQIYFVWGVVLLVCSLSFSPFLFFFWGGGRLVPKHTWFVAKLVCCRKPRLLHSLISPT